MTLVLVMDDPGPHLTIVDPSGLTIVVHQLGAPASPPIVTPEGLTVPLGYKAARSLAGVEFWGEVVPVSVVVNEVRWGGGGGWTVVQPCTCGCDTGTAAQRWGWP